MNWGEMLRIAVLQLGLSPDAFWRLSLVEWRWLTLPAADDRSLTRAEFDDLCALNPDGPHDILGSTFLRRLPHG